MSRENKKIRVGFVGAGWMGSEQLRRLAAREDVEVVALCELNAERGQAVLDEIGLKNTRLVSDFGELVGDATIDTIWLVSPNAHHGPQSIAALEAGKHVFCEKPASIRFEEHLRQVELAKANPQQRTFVDYILNFDSFEQRLRKMIADGAFGKVTQMQVNYRHAVNIAGDKVWKLKREVMGDAIGMGINHAVSVLLLRRACRRRGPAST